MSKKSTQHNGNGANRLDEAMALLIQNQATFVSQMAEMNRENTQRFARIEADLASIVRVLAEHSRILERLPDAVRDKIGFKVPPPPSEPAKT